MKALIVVDAQYDFMPGGALAVTDGDKIIPVINKLLKNYELVIFTKDWHNPLMNAFASQHEGKKPFDKYINLDGVEDTLWPDHCIVGTRGADLHEDIMFENCPNSFYIFKKGLDPEYHPYSGFGGTDLADFLREKEVTEVDVCGLAGDYCCKDTALDAVKEGFKTNFLMQAIKFINIDTSETLEILKKHNINLVF